MANNNETTTKFRVDISELKKEMQEAKRQVQVANSEFKAISSSMEDWTKSTDGISAKLKQLDSNLKSQKTVLSSLEKQYELTVAQMGEGSAQADRLKIAINNQKAVVNGTQKEIAKYESALEEVSKAETDTGKDADELGKDIKDLEGKTKEASEGFTVFKGVLANLATQGINMLIDGAKEAGKALVGLVKDSVSAYADAEQLRGGIETLFGTGGKTIEEYASSVGKSVDEVKDEYASLEKAQATMFKNANDAYKNAGMTANEYMETVTGFSASLIASMGGDTEKASEVANRAIIDMSDNANKMGTSMEGIQNAYAGFAKQNYTMLDNLSLGYGGTQQEMQRLIKDASKMKDVQKELGITVDGSSMSFENIINAISVMQSKMGIAGTTAEEAGKTISGSIGMMKSAWGNLLAGMADPTADFNQLVTNLVDSVTTMLGNIIPVVTQAIGGIGQLFTALAPIIATELPKMIDEVLPTLLDSLGALGKALLDAIISSAPTILNAVIDLISSIADTLPSTMVTIERSIGDLLIQILSSISDILPDILSSLIYTIESIALAILEKAPEILQAGIELFTGLVEALPEIINDLMYALDELIVELCPSSRLHRPSSRSTTPDRQLRISFCRST